MPSYLVAGASRGIGFEFLRQLSQIPDSTVIGIARSKEATEKKVKLEIQRDNIHIIQGDFHSYESLKNAAEATSKITGGSLDYIIANGAILSYFSEYANVGELGQTPKEFEEDLLDHFRTNVIGPIHLFNAFVPLLRRGSAKKAIALSSGVGDLDFISQLDFDVSPSYGISKAALNMAVAKFSAQYRKEGILFMSISPGFVDTGRANPADLSEEQAKGAIAMGAKFAEYAPHFKGPITPEESVKKLIPIIENASAEKDGGSFVSHFGNKQWL